MLTAQRNWVLDAACAQPGVPVDLWASACFQSAISQHICLQHCPVLSQCEEEQARLSGTPDRYREVVMAGVAYGMDGLGRRQDPAVACWLCSPHGLPVPTPTMRWSRDEDQPPRRARPGDGRCGTATGYRRHRLRDEPPCAHCRAWRREHDRQQRKAAAEAVAS